MMLGNCFWVSLLHDTITVRLKTKSKMESDVFEICFRVVIFQSYYLVQMERLMIREDRFVFLNDHKLDGIGTVAKLVKCDGSGNTACKVNDRHGIFYGFPVQT